MLAGCFSIRCYLLLPARRQDRLHLLTLLIDSRIPCEAGLLGEPRHYLNQLSPLRAQQHLAVAHLDRFHLVRGRTHVPTLDRHLLGTAMQSNP